MLLGLEVSWQRFASGRLCLLFRRGPRLRLFGRLWALVESVPLGAFDDGRCGWRQRRGGSGLALLYGEQLRDALVETRELLDELRTLPDESCELAALLGILSSQRFQVVHRRVQITLGDLCRSSGPRF